MTLNRQSGSRPRITHEGTPYERSDSQKKTVASGRSIDDLLNYGLAPDYSLVRQYKKALFETEGLAGDLLRRTINVILSNDQLFLKFRKVLGTTVVSLGRDTYVTASGLEKLAKKSVSSKVPLEKILEIYSRGYGTSSRDSDEAARKGFERVNSYLAGGKAATLDYDLSQKKQTSSIMSKVRKEITKNVNSR